MQAVQRQHQRQKAIGGQRQLAAVGEREIKPVALFCELPQPFWPEVGRRYQRGDVRGKIVALAVDVDAERQFEPVDTARFQRGIEVAGGVREPKRKVLVDQNLEAFGAQSLGMLGEKIEPAALVAQREIVGMTEVERRQCRPRVTKTNIRQTLARLLLLTLSPRDRKQLAGLKQLHPARSLVDQYRSRHSGIRG
ncbi:hypothetical protein [Bradyrhizobium sp. 179]|uniref:hypothetical protein n=1 Tax=Bradyrhizobium sp. 179 TaxID=2782648 RepID=UPI001FF9F936|nr:hypothetical protein [Bradyrhizobium sp. 179]